MNLGSCFRLSIAVLVIFLTFAFFPAKGLASAPDTLAQTVHHPLRLGDSGSDTGTTGITPQADTPKVSGFSPAQIRKAYGVDQLGSTGAGKTIAIVDAYGDASIVADLHAFDEYFKEDDFKFPDPVLTCYPAANIGTNSNWALETALDVEWAHAMAPEAKILLVVAPSASLGDLLNAVDYATDHADIVSMSLGVNEFSTENDFDYHFNHSGKVYVAASGDYGAEINWPAVSPYVVGVGGTELKVSENGTYTSETAWKGSGGGESQYVTKPDYQKDFQPSSHRTVPDVAFVGSPNTGVRAYSQGNWYSYVGGTSLSAPCWAGLFALGSQRDLAWLYSQAATDKYALNYHDITSGSNGLPAGAGYDMVTGLGSPIAPHLLPASASKLAFNSSDQTIVAGTASQSITIQTKDQSDNLVNVSSNATVNLASSSTSGNFSLDNATWASTVSGNITSENSKLTFYYQDTTAGTPTLTATSDGLSEASTSITISPAGKSQLIWGKQPVTSVSANATWPGFSVKIADQYGNQTSNDTDTVTIIPSSDTLQGSLSKTAAASLATFEDVSCNATGTLTLTAVSGNLTPSPVSGNITITPQVNPIIHYSGGGGGGGGGGGTAAAKITSGGDLEPVSLTLDSQGTLTGTARVQTKDGDVQFDIASGTRLLTSLNSPLASLTVTG